MNAAEPAIEPIESDPVGGPGQSGAPCIGDRDRPQRKHAVSRRFHIEGALISPTLASSVA